METLTNLETNEIIKLAIEFQDWAELTQREITKSNIDIFLFNRLGDLTNDEYDYLNKNIMNCMD